MHYIDHVSTPFEQRYSFNHEWKGLIRLSTRTSSLLLSHRSTFDITMIFVDASIKMYIYTNKTTLREIDGEYVHSFCCSETFYFSNILPHPSLVPPIIFPPSITNSFFPQIFLQKDSRLNSDIKIIHRSYSTQFSFKIPIPRETFFVDQIFSASFQASQLENFVVHNYPLVPPVASPTHLSCPRDAFPTSLFSLRHA